MEKTKQQETIDEIIHDAINRAVEKQVEATEAQVRAYCDINDYDDVFNTVDELMLHNPVHLDEAVDDAQWCADQRIYELSHYGAPEEIAVISEAVKRRINDHTLYEALSAASTQLANNIWEPIEH